MFRRFRFDVTEAARPGEVNRLAVRIGRIPEALVKLVLDSGTNSPAHLEVWHREIPPASQWPLTNYDDPVLIRKNVFHGAMLKENWLHKELTERIFGPFDRLEDLVLIRPTWPSRRR